MVIARLILAIEPVLDQMPNQIGLRGWLRDIADGALSQIRFAGLRCAVNAKGQSEPIATDAGAAADRFQTVIADYAAWATWVADSSERDDAPWPVPLQQWRKGTSGYGGTPVTVIVTGVGEGRILFFGAPGLPAEMCGGWISGLSRLATVATVETRGLLGCDHEEVGELGVAAQIADAATLIEELGWDEFEVVGVCGGAALALAFASQNRCSTRSLSLWFGDYELGDAAPKTEHQHNLKSLMEMVATGSATAADVLDMLFAVISHGLPPERAPFCLYPFVSAQLFERYCQMNSKVMSLDCAAAAAGVSAPCQVGFSDADQTAHPKGSQHICALLDAQADRLIGVSHIEGVFGRAADVARVLDFHRSLDQAGSRHAVTRPHESAA